MPADQFRQAFDAYFKQVAEVRGYVKEHGSDDELLAAYDKLLGTLDAYKVYLAELGRIQKSADDRLANESFQSGYSAGRNGAMAGFAASDYGASTRQSIAAAGIAAAGTYLWDIYQKGQARNAAKTQAVDTARSKFGQALDGYQASCRQIAQRLTTKYGWQPGEAGFEESDDYLATRAKLIKESNLGGLAQLEQTLQARRPRDSFIVGRKTYLLTMQQDSTLSLRLEAAKECLQAASLVPAGAFYDRYRTDLLCTSAQALESVAAQELGSTTMMDAANEEAALGVQVWAAALRYQQDFSGELRQHQAIALAMSGDLAAALQEAELVAGLRSRDAPFAYFLACLYSDTGNVDKSLDWLRQAVATDGYNHIAELKKNPDLATVRTKKSAEVTELFAVRCDWKLEYGTFNDDLVATNNSKFALTNVTISGTIQPNNKGWQDLRVDTIPAGGSYRWKKAVSVPGSKANVDASHLKLSCDQGECQMTPAI